MKIGMAIYIFGCLSTGKLAARGTASSSGSVCGTRGSFHCFVVHLADFQIWTYHYCSEY